MMRVVIGQTGFKRGVWGEKKWARPTRAFSSNRDIGSGSTPGARWYRRIQWGSAATAQRVEKVGEMIRYAPTRSRDVESWALAKA